MNKQDLTSILDLLKHGISDQEAVNSFSSFIFENGYIFSSKNDTITRLPITDKEINGAVKAKELYELLAKLENKEDVIITVSEKELLIEVEKTKAGLKLEKIFTSPSFEVPKPEEWQKLPENIVEGLIFVKNNCSTELSRPFVSCVHFRRDGLLEATDGYSLSVFDTGEIFTTKNFLLTKSIISVIIDFNPSFFHFQENVLFFKKDQVILKCPTTQIRFPDTESLFPSEGKELIFPSSIKSLLEKVLIFSTKKLESNSEINITFEKDKFIISSRNDYGWIDLEESIPYSGPSFSFYIDPSFFRDIFSRNGKVFIEERKKILFTGENWKYLVCLIDKRKK